jgi:hypothetical protein
MAQKSEKLKGEADVRLLEQVRADHRRKKSEGYTRGDAFADLEAVYVELDTRVLPFIKLSG